MQGQKSLAFVAKASNVRDTLASKKGFRAWYTQTLARLLERQLGTELLIELPQALLEFGLESEEPLRIIKRLSDAGYPISYPKFSRHFENEPRTIRIFLGPDSGGGHFFDKSAALWSALAEYLERRIWRESSDWYKNALIFGKYADFQDRAIDPLAFSGISPQLREEKTRLKIEPESKFGWMAAKPMGIGNEKLIPTQITSPSYANGTKRKELLEPGIREVTTNGLATGQSLSEAVVKGAFELIERDAFMIAYLNRLSPPRLDLEHLAKTDAELAEVLARIKRYQLELHVVLLPTDIGSAYAVAAILIDRTGNSPAFALGARAEYDLRTCVFGSLVEAVSVRASLIGNTPIPDDFPREKIGRLERLDYWIDTSRLPSIAFLTSGPLVQKAYTESVPKFAKKEERARFYEQRRTRLADDCRSQGCSLYFVELFDQRVRQVTDLRFAFVVSPELQPLHLREDTPHFHGSRLAAVPKKLGYTAAVELNRLPHPFP